VLQRLAGILSNAANAPQELLDELRRTAESAESEVSGMAPHVLGLLDEMEHLSSVPASTATGGRRDAGTEDRPPTSNRGVRITAPASKIAHISPMKKGEKHGRSQK
jgi:hypothetical protein